jgi:hypothetical protein
MRWRGRGCSWGRVFVLGAAIGLAACGSKKASAPGANANNCTQPADPEAPPHDYLSPTRLLRRIALSLTGAAPSASDYQPLIAAKDDAARQAILDQFVDDALASPNFYEIMRDFGSQWVPILPLASVGDEPGYIASQQSNIGPCPAGTPYAGALTVYHPSLPGYPPCSGKLADGTPAPVKQVEPWWAPGTTVTVIGYPTNEAPTITLNNVTYDCASIGPDPYGVLQIGCGCGPHLAWCHGSTSQGWANYPIFSFANPGGQRRLLWEEPARLIAHIAWYDRPLTDVILGNYSVGPVEVQAAYVRAGRVGGASQLDADDSWWKPALFTGAVDPGHDAKDPAAWREFIVAARDPYLLAERDYKFDPRTQPRDSMKGTPSAGVLTMIGVNGSLPRERVRAARMLEWFACEDFIPPPADQKFNPFVRDPAVEGPCQACHTRIDPAAIHFKRWQEYQDYPRAYLMLGVGKWTYDDAWTTGSGYFNYGPFVRMSRAWLPGTKMTPVSQADSDKNAETRFIDFLPPDQTLLGQTSDGTVGPLGFAKMVVASGAFDRCAVRRLHERFGGRALNPATEAGYIDSLVDTFVKNGRKVRPFLKALTHTDVFRRGL